MQLHYGLKNGFGLNNGIGSTIWLASMAGLVGLLAVNIYAIIRTNGVTLMTTNEQMINGFFFTMVIAGILISLQVILALNGSSVVFIPNWLKSLIYILIGVGIFGWVMLVAFHGIASAITVFRSFMGRRYGWLIFGGVLALLIGLFVIFKDSDFSFFKKEDAIFTFDEKDKVKKIVKEEPIKEITENDKVAEKESDNGAAEKAPVETEQIISDANGVTVSQTLVDGKVVQRINDEAPDAH